MALEARGTIFSKHGEEFADVQSRISLGIIRISGLLGGHFRCTYAWRLGVPTCKLPAVESSPVPRSQMVQAVVNGENGRMEIWLADVKSYEMNVSK